MDEITNWGYHISLDCGSCDIESISSYEVINNFSYNIVDRVDMKMFGSPYIVRFGENGKFGYTMITLISTSNLAAHFCESTSTMYFDLFSCKPFDVEVVKQCVKEYFGKNITMKVHYFERNAL